MPPSISVFFLQYTLTVCMNPFSLITSKEITICRDGAFKVAALKGKGFHGDSGN